MADKDKKQSKKKGSEDKEEKQLQPFHTLLIAIVIIVAAILIGQAVKDAGQTTDEGAPEDTQEEQMMEDSDGEGMNGENGESDGQPVNTNVMSVDEFDDREQAVRIINSTQGKRVNTQQYETIRGPVLRDGANENVVYFATGEQNADPHFVGIYRYDTVSNRWERKFKFTYEAEDGLSATQPKVIGRTGSDLIVLLDRLDREHDECDSYWLTGTQEDYNLVTLDLDNPLDGFSNYELPDKIRNQEETRVAECES
jgi:hypothetical protein